MVDIVDAATRSRFMSGIRGTNTRPELLVRSLLHGMGFRYGLHVRTLPGKPDIVLTRHRAVVFVHGCFWHGHACHLYRVPSTRRDFWLNKINQNRHKDSLAEQALLQDQWRIAVVWECALKGRSRRSLVEIGQKLERWILSKRDMLTIRGRIE